MRAVIAATMGLGVLLSAGVSAAQTVSGSDQGRGTGTLHMFNETARIVDVVDSFDAGSNFSFRLSAGYHFTNRSTGIDRELRTSNNPLGTLGYQRVAEYSESTHTLMLNAEVGLFRDLALTFGAPIVLSNTRQLRAPGGVSAADLQRTLADGWTHNGMATQLFWPSFDSPERSGIDQVRLGLQWAILNQQRDRTYPTWMVRFEWRPPGVGIRGPGRLDGGGRRPVWRGISGESRRLAEIRLRPAGSQGQNPAHRLAGADRRRLLRPVWQRAGADRRLVSGRYGSGQVRRADGPGRRYFKHQGQRPFRLPQRDTAVSAQG